jgi:hypothetical protein
MYFYACVGQSRHQSFPDGGGRGGNWQLVSGMNRAEPANRWSGRVSRESHALALEKDVFTWADPGRIAESLKHSAETSNSRKSEPFRSAMSTLNFYINRAGRKLAPDRRRVLNEAKTELRKRFNKS